jgi:hypothetical protein
MSLESLETEKLPKKRQPTQHDQGVAADSSPTQEAKINTCPKGA